MRRLTNVTARALPPGGSAVRPSSSSRFCLARVARYVERLAALQDLLGRLNDAAVGDVLLREAEQSDPALAHDASFARGCLLAAAQRDADGRRAVWRRFKATSSP